jgi:membrane protein YdbS with pleckstrin-like domain
MDNPSDREYRDTSASAQVAVTADTVLGLLLLLAIPILAVNFFGGLNPEYSSQVRAMIGMIVVAVFVRLVIRWASHHVDPRYARRPPDAP